MRRTRHTVMPAEKYGNLTVIQNTGKADSSGNAIWLCQCDCGRLVEKSSRYLHRDTVTHSCGCMRGFAHTKHGDKKRHAKANRIYSIWRGMLWRCDKQNQSKNSYSRRGISVCEEWHDYKTFKDWAIANGYADGLSIDRIDYYGNYEPNNCRWVTPLEQANNKSNNHLITHDNKTMTLAEWARELGINYSTLRSRINRQGLSPEVAFRTNSGSRDEKTGKFIGGYDID